MNDGVTLECILCEDPLTSANETAEHAIPYALGGGLTTTRATCVTCNSKSGDTIDAKLVSMLQPFAVQLNVTRDRGSHPAIPVRDATTGRKVALRPGQPAVFEEDLKVTK